MRNSFPKKSEEEIQKLAKGFYKYLCDITLETFKTLTISKKAMLKRCWFDKESLRILNDFAEQNKSGILTMGHLGNWEWSGNSFSLLCKQQLYVIYHPLSNKHFDKLLYNMRTRFGTGLIPMDNVFRGMLKNRTETTLTAFIADQTPPPDNAYWMTFLNQDTPVFKGTEVIATKMNYPVLYATVERKKRGYYEIHVELLAENPKSLGDGELTELHTRRLEKDIRVFPETWIWSHRRWKHKRNKQ